MSTPQNQNSRGPRRSARKLRNSLTPNGNLPTGIASDTDSALHRPQSKDDVEEKLQNKRKSQVSKRGGNVSDGPQNHDRSLTQGSQPERTRATPIKQAYAGPTFHQSPAASALPIPKFYSKSVPNASSTKPSNVTTDNASEESEQTSQQEESPTQRESTPLDFLFEAARQARGTPRAESPLVASGQLSVPTRSPASRSPAPREGDSMFPFELDGAVTPGEDGSSFVTPFKDRMEAVRSTKSTTTTAKNAQPMDELERKAKSDALKKLLRNSQTQAQGTSNQYDMNNPFNARAPPSRGHADTNRSQVRPHSGPSTPSPSHNHIGLSNHGQYFPTMPYNGNIYSTPHRPPSSNLRNVYGNGSEPEPAELSSDGAVTSPPRISTARKQPVQPQGARHGYDLRGSNPTNQSQPSPQHRSTPSAQQLEDDLRRVLKLDLTSRG